MQETTKQTSISYEVIEERFRGAYRKYFCIVILNCQHAIPREKGSISQKPTNNQCNKLPLLIEERIIISFVQALVHRHYQPKS